MRQNIASEELDIFSGGAHAETLVTDRQFDIGFFYAWQLDLDIIVFLIRSMYALGVKVGFSLAFFFVDMSKINSQKQLIHTMQGSTIKSHVLQILQECLN